ncbi:MAG: ThiF family adenylyltransferase [Nitrospirae bacterium]|nr:ThiF family adenylyltransferase [Nitrospirota bacterium]
MARVMQDRYWFEMPDDEYTSTQLQEKAGMDRDAIPVIRRGDKDIAVEPDEVVRLEPEDRVIFTTPTKAAFDMKPMFFNLIRKVASRQNAGAMNSVPLVFREDDYKCMREHLLREDSKERVSFILFGTRGEDPVKEAFVHRIINLEDSEYARQSGMHVVPKIVSQMKAFRAFSSSDIPGFMHVHSHPFADNAEFSYTDRKSVAETVRSLRDYLTSDDKTGTFLYGTLVMGRSEKGFSGVFYDYKSAMKEKLGEIRTIGIKGFRRIRSYETIASRETAIPDIEMLDRNIKWLGEEGQKRLSETSMVICGAGGVGGMVAMNIRGLGLKKITLIDDDWIEKSNLNRLPSATLHDVGEYKVNVMARMIKDVSPGTEVDTIPEKVSCDEGRTRKAIAEADIIVAAVDSFQARFDIQWLAARYLKPLIDIGSGINLSTDTSTVKFMGGQIACYVPGGPCLCCQAVVPRDIESEFSREVKKMTGYVKGTDITPTSVVTINSIVAGYAVDVIIKFITGFSEIQTYMKYDLLNMTSQTFNFGKKTDCLICGHNGVEGKGDDVITVPFGCSNVFDKKAEQNNEYPLVIHGLFG